ncbi:ABC transporter ATP-binding protein [Coraliomargarita akajimensis]|uniref:ABC transporter related protein n=1 Tax=Coraliomargarita akajimensis (strain DSM 45221 / IAM 15411 / JCM 23193 / KCTC 12865 / 04OKA010-24) TaxID=583355 RepID=D5EPV8_CORAD|nr:ABC transporter ATP-binding protein [Coraliomargarita akajimensis]ADE55691.1 ABC transporter related protein [Coraliomargarita akajimensis DSM 45221]
MPDELTADTKPSQLDAALTVRDLHKSYGAVEVLHCLDLEVANGERVALMGRSGSGKSTLLNCVCGIEPYDRGVIEIAGHRLAELTEIELEQLRCEQIGYVFQDFNLLPMLTAQENVELPAQLFGMSRVERVARARQLLSVVGLESRAEHRPAAMSGGECQRVALARALMNRPRVLLADEPTGSLDSVSGDLVLDLIERVSREFETAVLLVTHDDESTRICDRVVRIVDGAIVEADS